MVRPNPRYADPSSPDVIDDLTQLRKNLENAEKLADRAWGDYPSKNSQNPSDMPLPSWWDGGVFENHESHFTKEQAIEYLKVSQKIIGARRAIMTYHCDVLGSTRDCQNLATLGGTGRIERNIRWLEAQIIGLCPGNNTPDSFKLCPKEPETFEILPQVFAEEDPSINSGLNGNEQESQVVNYPQSANVKITFTNSNIGMFSSSIPINDIGQLQILSNESDEWRYTLIGSSTNQPLRNLPSLMLEINKLLFDECLASGVCHVDPEFPQPQPQPQPQPPQLPPIEEPHITTDHITPPDMPVEEPPMVTVTPTEPSQVNWIPEPFFSFINNMFRR